MQYSNEWFRAVIGGADGLNMQVPHLHGQYELYYLLEGKRTFFIRDTAYSMVPGSLAFLDGEQLHRVFSPADIPHKRMVIFFEKDQITDPAFVQMFQSGGCITLNQQERAEFDRTVEQLSKEISSGRPFDHKAADVLTRYLLILACRARLSPRPPLHYRETAISDAVSYIGDHFAEHLSLPRVCAEVGMSVSHFTATFKASTGFTFVEYINHIRIRHAARLLEQTDMSVAEIAGRVGFSSFSYFSARFKEICGISPLHYRKKEG